MTDSDPRVRRGMERQVALRRRMLDEGARHLGWKVGFGAPAALERLSIDLPLVGFLTDRTVVPDGGEGVIADSVNPVAEAEIALHLGSDIPPGSGESHIRRAIAALGPAIELADVSPPPTDVEEILAGDIFHHSVVLGPTVEPGGTSLVDGLEARVVVGGRSVEVPADLEALTGRLLSIVGLVADLVGVHGERLVAGDVILPGSIVPPQPLTPGDRVRFTLSPAGSVEIVTV